MEIAKLPNLFLLGPAKTATTSLAHWLSQHKNFFVSEPKETLYFEFEYDRGPLFYMHKYFRHHRNEEIICDARPMNLVVGYCAERIKVTCPNAKFIVVLRHPFERTFSDWGNWARMRPGRAINNFDKAITDNMLQLNINKFDLEGDYVPYCDTKGGSYKPTYIEASLYGGLLTKFMKHFDRDRFLLLDFESVIQNPQATIDKICYFMNTDNQIIHDLGKKNMVPSDHKSLSFEKIKAFLSWQNEEALADLFTNDKNMLNRFGNTQFTDKWKYE